MDADRSKASDAVLKMMCMGGIEKISGRWGPSPLASGNHDLIGVKIQNYFHRKSFFSVHYQFQNHAKIPTI